MFQGRDGHNIVTNAVVSGLRQDATQGVSTVPQAVSLDGDAWIGNNAHGDARTPLLAIGSTAYLSLMGPAGLREVARQSHAKASYAADRIAAVPGFAVLTPGPFYNEFLVRSPVETFELRHRLVQRHILACVPFFDGVEGLERTLLLAFTEQNTRSEIDTLVDALAEASR